MAGILGAFRRTQAERECQRLPRLLHSCKHVKRDRQAKLTSVREQLAAIKPLASVQPSAGCETFADVLLF